MDNYVEIVEKAYKKLKANIFYDKTQLVLRNKLVEFERNDKFEERLVMIHKSIFEKDEILWENLSREIFESIDVQIFPKNLNEEKNSGNNHENNIIFNSSNERVDIEEGQYFIDMNVEGHIIGVLWVLLIGKELDSEIYKHSYGNRLNKNAKEEISFSPHLFEPYFQQYESWRDIALEHTKEILNENIDAVILSMDFKKYYYSLDINEEIMKKIFNEIEIIENKFVYERINNFIYKIIEEYSLKIISIKDKMIEEFKINKRNILPIGFLPSNIIANLVFKRF